VLLWDFRAAERERGGASTRDELCFLTLIPAPSTVFFVYSTKQWMDTETPSMRVRVVLKKKEGVEL
jgi:hypothetical protein